MENNIKNNKQFAWFWIRHVAFFVDIVILLLIWMLFWFILNLLWIQIDNTTTTWFIISLCFDLFWFLYFACFHHHFWQTPWKMLVWVEVVNKEFWKISRIQAIWRSFATILSTIPLFLWYAWAWWDAKKRTFHDLLAQTVVVEKNAISSNWAVFWNVLIFILWVLMIFWVVMAFYYLIQHPELLMQIDPELLK